MPKPNDNRPLPRTPLSRERVLTAAMALADTSGLDAVTMRSVAKSLGVEAMSLYRHVANKGDILDGLVELVVSEMAVPSPDVSWRKGLHERAISAREVLNRHRWATMLIESRMSPGPARLRLYNGVILVLRKAGFSIELTYSAFLTLDSYIYGFTLQEQLWSYEPEERLEVIENVRPEISPTEYPHIVEMMNFMMTRNAKGAGRATSSAAGYAADFEFGLGLVLDGLERAHRAN